MSDAQAPPASTSWADMVDEDEKQKQGQNMNSQDDGWGEAATETSAPAPAPAPASAPVSNNSNNDGWGEPAPSAPADNGWGEAGASNGGNGANNNDGWFDAPVPPSSRPPKKEASDIQLQDDTEGLITSTFQVEVKLADLQGDPNSPLYSVQSFKQLNLHEDLMKGIIAAGFQKPSKIQEKALPLLLSNPPRNLIGQSQSGTGKTAAFTLNMLSRVDPTIPTPQAICIAPSRELARQIQEVIDQIGQFTQVGTFLAVPGSWSRNARIDKQILIGTPGTLVDMLMRGSRILDPRMIRVLVLDEADELIAQQGLGEQTFRIKQLLPPNIQNVLFSATFNDDVQEFADRFAPEANKIFLRKEDITVDAIRQLYLECDSEDQKYEALSALYDCLVIGQSIVFCKRKATADHIAERLISEGHAVASLHGDKFSQERDAILDGFRNGETKVLITTNVIARGIDIPAVNMVVNYDVPDLGPGGSGPDIETYIHRIGRTGRFGRKGCSVVFTHDYRSKSDVERIMNTLGKPMKRIDARSTTDIEQLEKALKLAMKGPA
ncbi:ATP-dependent RNA helicase DBP5 [Cryptococcus gattii E566]|uniref:RNA helicase n=3 Tax=Cryptococcus gattii TaxID=37769 RepID=E6RAS8_CRYGW|nr:ATP-dependent RNA helicase, putative [Cryptococcus gattii WM276]ADV23914.1 ATP-dependent RNA helicase, putative [Cryptococcus gattii WM276]KIY35050.1 ATP-dependent RNA helicase DBP5 [Cryptococcus gattii E566]KJE03820.1 ATP-dependent RNA helicase DBP5 [Cryptococcus gattii NT-10]